MISEKIDIVIDIKENELCGKGRQVYIRFHPL